MKAKKFRELLNSSKPIIIVAAHTPLSARLVEEAGFDGIWASSFEISAAHCMPDANIVTMTEMLDVTKDMDNKITIPVIADCDNGYGNAINVIRTVQEYEKAGIAGISIEDNIFPKRCSFYEGVKRELETIEEFAGKIRAAKEAQRSKDFVVIARTEALIAGYGQEEAIRRAEAYSMAGADMILPHSKSTDPKEVISFAKEWFKKHKTPLISVPTIYKEATVDQLYKAGFKMIIFANHGIRASIKAMRQTFQALKEGRKPAAADKYIVSLPEVYGLIGVEDMKNGESKYLPKGKSLPKAIILSAGKTPEPIRIFAGEIPVAMLNIKGKPLLSRQVEVFGGYNIRDISVVRGYNKEKITIPEVNYFDNPDYETKWNLHSLFTAQKKLDGTVIICLGDLLFDESVLGKLLTAKGDINLVIDRAWLDAPTLEHRPDLVETTGNFTNRKRLCTFEGQTEVKKIGRLIDPRNANGEFIGIVMLSPKGTETFKKVYKEAVVKYKGKKFHEVENIGMSDITNFIQEIIDQGYKVSTVDISKGWLDIDNFEDFQKAWVKPI